MFTDERRAREQAAEACRAAHKAAIQRFVVYTRVTELVIETLYSPSDKGNYKKISDEARRLLRDAALANFSDSIMRLELLLATLALNAYGSLQERHARALSYVTSGQANSIRFGNGLFDWAFDNLMAVIDLNDERRPGEEVRRRFLSCLYRLRNRDLTFVGAQSGIYPNTFAISNIVRYFGSHSESKGVEYLQSNITGYDFRFLNNEREGLDIVRRAIRGAAIFWPSSRFQMLRYPARTGYFTPVF